MEENLEIYFCEICNESVPAKDLPIGDSRTMRNDSSSVTCASSVCPS